METPCADAWCSPWVSFNVRGTVFDAASSTVEVVDITSEASAERAGLWPLGAQSASQGGVVQDNFWMRRSESFAAHCPDVASCG